MRQETSETSPRSRLSLIIGREDPRNVLSRLDPPQAYQELRLEIRWIPCKLAVCVRFSKIWAYAFKKL